MSGDSDGGPPVSAGTATGGLLLLALFVLVGTACSDEGPRPVKGPQLVTFGHSYVSGREPDYDVTPWPERTGRALSLPVDNLGVSGRRPSKPST